MTALLLQVAKDPGRLLRIDFFPGLGWIMRRKIFEEELEQIWPDSNSVSFDQNE